MKKYLRKIILSKFAKRAGEGKEAFTLIELLIVIAIIAILGTLLGPSLTSILSGSDLSQGAQMIEDQLTLCRQLAINNNYVVEVRIYNYIDSTIAGDTGHYRGIQAFKVTPQVPPTTTASGQILFNKTAITKAMHLPHSVIIDAGGGTSNSSNISYLIGYLSGTPGFYSSYNLGPTPSAAPQSPLPGDPSLFNVGTTYTYVAFQLNPDGSTNLSQTGLGWSCVMTLHALSSGDQLSTANLPKNYYTIQIDPTNGHIYGYQP